MQLKIVSLVEVRGFFLNLFTSYDFMIWLDPDVSDNHSPYILFFLCNFLVPDKM
jgi:hypothetical protein